MDKFFSWFSNLIATLLLTLIDLIFAGALVVLGIIVLVLVPVVGIAWTPITIIAVLCMFAIKSGLWTRFNSSESHPVEFALLSAGAVTLFAAIGSFGFLSPLQQ